MEKICGTVDTIIFASQDNRFTVLKLSTRKTFYTDNSYFKWHSSTYWSTIGNRRGMDKAP